MVHYIVLVGAWPRCREESGNKMRFKFASFVFCVCFIHVGHFTDPLCVINLECPECIPENMALVTSHSAFNGSLTIPSGEEVAMTCSGGKFLAYPLQDSLVVVCEGGRYRVRVDNKLRHLLDLGCQANIFEDVLHSVEHCGAPLQGRAYQIQEGGSGGVRHLATVCFDEDRALAVRARATNVIGNLLRMAPHSDQAAPLSLFGNFNHMFDAQTRHDAEKLYSDDTRMNRRLREMFKHDRVSFADQALTSAKLLSGHYFDDQNMRVAEFVSNRVAAWRSVARGNLDHLHRDVAKYLKRSRPLAEVEVFAGTHGVMSLRTGHTKSEVHLRAGNRFPVPKYIWNVVHDKRQRKAIAIVVLNDPFVAVSEIKDSVFCESACGRISWLHELRRNRNYECPINGLVFCCSFHSFTDIVGEMPRDLVNITAGNAGMLTDFDVAL